MNRGQLTEDEYKNWIRLPEFEASIKNDILLIEKGQAGFFEEHAGLINRFFLAGQPNLAINLWLLLLEQIKQIEPNRYQKLPKGTAYYWIGINSLNAGRFDYAIQWLEYAFEADSQTEHPAKWLLSFDKDRGQNDFGYTDIMRNKIDQCLAKIKQHDSQFQLNISQLKNIVTSKILVASRSLRAAWAALFVSILEYNEIEQFLSISPQNNEAQFEVNTFFVRLTLILETLIAKSPIAPSKQVSREDTLAKLYRKIICPVYGFNKCAVCFLDNNNIPKDYSRNMIAEVQNAEKSQDKCVVSFVVALRVRNASHHLFNESFIDINLFRELSLRIYYAIFSIIEKLYGQGATP